MWRGDIRRKWRQVVENFPGPTVPTNAEGNSIPEWNVVGSSHQEYVSDVCFLNWAIVGNRKSMCRFAMCVRNSWVFDRICSRNWMAEE